MTLNDKQREAVETTEGPVLVIAGAGSGKTRVLTERIAHLVRDKGVQPWNILAFTFTNKAAREMKERLEGSLPGVAEALWVGTFHATGVRILRRNGDRIDLSRDFSIYDADDSLNVIKAILGRRIMDGQVMKSPRTVRDAISRLKNDLISPDQAAEIAGGRLEERVAEVYREYERELRRANALDFDDLIAKVVELFAADDDTRDYYANRFRYVLVDEFQDTNAIQMAMIDGLSSAHRNLFVVGDDDQSIYSWRGARIEHILEFENLYSNTNVIRLEQNYRSTKTILDAANEVIAHNRGRKGKNLWTDGDQGDKVRLMVSGDEEGEALNVLGQVQEEVKSGLALKDIAILYRTNAQSRALEDVLKMGSTPYQIIGSVKFYDRMEVRDVMAYCKVLANPADTVNLKRIINTPRRGIGKTSFERLEAAALEGNTSVIDVLRNGAPDLTPAAASRCRNFLKTFDYLEGVAHAEVAPHVITEVIDQVDYMSYLKDNYPDSEARIENVEELVNAAHAFAEGAEDRSLRAFLEEVALVADVDSLDETSGQLTLMTAHNAKGLEYDCVIVAGMEDGLFPHYNSIDDETAVEEERRLFYVAMTRARKKLYLSMAHTRRRMGHIEGGVPSRFLYEVPERCLEQTIEQFAGLAGDSAAGWASRSRRGGGHLSHAASLFSYDEPETETQEPPEYESFSQEEFSQEEVAYNVGMRILHEQFGTGVVRRVEGQGEQMRVTVIFDRGAERKFLAKFAPMRPVT